MRISACLTMTLVFLWGCSPGREERLAAQMGKTGRVLIVASVDPTDPSTHQWFEDVKLVRLTRKDGKPSVLLRFVGLEKAASNQGQEMELSIPVDQIVEVRVGEEVVYVRDP